MTAALTDDELQSLAVFPLPEIVLFPGAVLGLHIFEPRYREMMADCLREERLVLAMAQLKAGYETDYGGRPPVFEVAGAGRIIRHTMRSDGTYDLQLQGLSRVRLAELPPERSYRRARATLLPDQAPGRAINRSELSALFSLAAQLTQIAEGANPKARVALHASLDEEPGRMIDKLADQFISDPTTRQRLLETLDVGERLRQVKRSIIELQLAFSGRDNAPGSRTLH